MKLVLASLMAAAGLLLTVPAVQAFECPKHFSDAEETIAAATDAMEGMSGGKELVNTLIEDAKMYLESARRNHEQPTAGGYDHARALAKADAAIGYANAARMLAER